MPVLRIAFRYLRARHSHNAVNVITFVSMAGIAVAVAAMVVVLSIFNGFGDLAAANMAVLDAPCAYRRVAAEPSPMPIVCVALLRHACPVLRLSR